MRSLHSQCDGNFLAEIGVQFDAKSTPGDPAVNDQFIHDPAREIDRNAESDSLVAAAVGGDGVVDADDLAFHVDEWTAGVARIDRGVCLEEILVFDVFELVHVTAASADDSLAHGVHQSERTPEGKYPGPNRGVVAVAQLGRWEVVAVELQNGNIGFAVVPGLDGQDGATVAKRDPDLGGPGAVNDMVVR